MFQKGFGDGSPKSKEGKSGGGGTEERLLGDVGTEERRSFLGRGGTQGRGLCLLHGCKCKRLLLQPGPSETPARREDGGVLLTWEAAPPGPQHTTLVLCARLLCSSRTRSGRGQLPPNTLFGVCFAILLLLKRVMNAGHPPASQPRRRLPAAERAVVGPNLARSPAVNGRSSAARRPGPGLSPLQGALYQLHKPHLLPEVHAVSTGQGKAWSLRARERARRPVTGEARGAGGSRPASPRSSGRVMGAEKAPLRAGPSSPAECRTVRPRRLLILSTPRADSTWESHGQQLQVSQHKSPQFPPVAPMYGSGVALAATELFPPTSAGIGKGSPWPLDFGAQAQALRP